VYYIYRDLQGSITHITNSSGTLVQELSYDAWGRLRNPVTQVAYAPDGEPTLFLGRGYTGHEHLTWLGGGFGLINMNARLYDPALGRFLSPDPYVQAPDFTQNFNRYSYALNNPLVYVDQDGEIVITTAILIGAGVSILINYAVQIASNYASGYKGADAWINNIDYLDLAINGLIGGITAGASNGVTATTAFGKTLISIAKSKAWEYGSLIGGSLLTSFMDLNIDGFQTKSLSEGGSQFIFNMVVSRASYVSGKTTGDFLSKTGDVTSFFAKETSKKLIGEYGQSIAQYWLAELAASKLYDSAVKPMIPNINTPNYENPQTPNTNREIPGSFPKNKKEKNMERNKNKRESYFSLIRYHSNVYNE